MPSSHIKEMPKGCVECHTAKFEDEKEQVVEEGGHTFKANMNFCLKCHGDIYVRVPKLKLQVEKLLKEVEQMLESVSDKESKAYKDAKLNYDLVKADKGCGFHNFEYAKALLEYSLSLREKLGEQSQVMSNE
jgi:formate-dependent nitrite reductase cytochrome c552 subunit